MLIIQQEKKVKQHNRGPYIKFAIMGLFPC
jgi:hypothetical protein